MRDSKATLWIISEVFYPNETSTAYILTNIAKAMSEKYNVKVICEDESKSQYIPDSFIDQVAIHKIRTVKLDERKIRSRAQRQVILTLKLFNAAFSRIRRKDNVLIVTNPAPLILAMSFLKKLIGFNYTILVHDVFPENTIPAGIFTSANNKVYRLIKKRFDSAYSCADKLITLGQDMYEVIKQKVTRDNVDIEIIENWADCNRIKAENQVHDKINLLYAGNFGRVQGLDTLLAVIKKVNNAKLYFYFRGKGALQNKIDETIHRCVKSNISIGGAYSRDEESAVLNSCDVAFVSLSSGMYGLGVPSKSYNIMAAGKPIIFIGDLNSEISLMIKKFDIGWRFSCEDQQKLVDFLNGLTDSSRDEIYNKGKRAREVAENYYSKDIILSKFKSLI